jgi:uncharacterized membrane protein
MNARRKALIVANDAYDHEGLGQLRAPSADAQALAGVLGDEQIGDFDVRVVRNEPAHIIQALIEELFSEARPDDVLLVHFSCHGLKSEAGELFFAAANTRPNRLGSTAVSADFVQRCLRTSRSRSVVLLLDCCYGGAFARGVAVRAAGDVNVLGSFPPERSGSGRGRAVITASSAMEYAFEGDQLADDAGPQPSVFTSALVEGLASGEADRNQDGWVSLDELYDYVFDKVRERNPNQTPSRAVEMQGDLFIARRSRPVTTPAPLPPELRQAIDSPLAGVRGGAVEELARVLRGGHAGLVLAARIALEDLAQDDSRHVSAAASAALRSAAAPRAPVAAEPAAVEPAAVEPAAVEPAAAELAPTPAPTPAATPAPAPLAAGPVATGTVATGTVATGTVAPAAERPAADVPMAASPAAERASAQAEAHAPPEPDAALPGPTRPASPLLLTTGALAVIEAVLLVVSIYPTYASDYRLLTLPVNVASLLINAAVTLAAGICLLIPQTSRLIGTGLLIGVTATTPTDLQGTLAFLANEEGGPGPGAWLIIVACILGLITIVLVVASLWHGRDVRFAWRSLAARRGQAAAWVVVALGVAGAAAFAIQFGAADYLAGDGGIYIKGHVTIPLIWITFLALALPALAVTARPRSFGVALAAGWVGIGLSEVVFDTGLKANVFGYTLIAMAIALVPLARTARDV